MRKIIIATLAVLALSIPAAIAITPDVSATPGNRVELQPPAQQATAAVPLAQQQDNPVENVKDESSDWYGLLGLSGLRKRPERDHSRDRSTTSRM